MEEIWKPVIRSNKRYLVSNFGTVKINESVGWRNYKNYIMRQHISNSGYMRIGLWINNKQVKMLTHKIVIESFYGKKNNGFVVNHKDGNKLNNSIDNLEYVTQKENIRHSIKNGLTRQKGENHPGAKLKNFDVLYIRRNKDILSSRTLADKYGVITDTIRNVILGKTYKNV